MFDKRYSRNGIFSKEEMERIKNSRICVVGCGGLGGYIIEMLCRIGIGHLTVVDGDSFDETNLNRQILSNEYNLGESKAKVAAERLKVIDSEISCVYHLTYLTDDNANEIIKGHDLVLDALDNIESRIILQDSCEKMGIPLIHGAISGWFGQVATIYPGDKTLDSIYRNSKDTAVNQGMGNPSFTPATVASIQVSEAIKVLLGRGCILRHKLLHIDILENKFQELELI